MRRDLYTANPGEVWRGVLTEIRGPCEPRLKAELSEVRRFRIVQGDDPLLWCRAWPDWYGVEVAWDQPLSSVIPPISANAARDVADAEGARWMQRWAHRMLDLLMSSTSGPLHDGRWTVEPMAVAHAPSVLAMKGLRLISVDVDEDLQGTGSGSLYWGNQRAQVVPLRPLSPIDAARVKAFRKLANEGLLPPVLLWWVNGLAAPVILDGHDRFTAARAENLGPPMLCLSHVMSVEDARARGGWNDLDEVAKLRHVFETQPTHAAAHEALSRRVGQAMAQVEHTSTTRAWTAPVPPEAWPDDWP